MPVASARSRRPPVARRPRRAPADEPLLGVHVSTAGGLLEGLRRARELGLTAIQVFTSNPRQWAQRPLSDDEAERFRIARAEAGIRAAFAHDSYLVRLGHCDDALLTRSLASFVGEMDRSRRLGLDGVVTHPSAYPGCPRDEALWRIAEALNAIVARQRGRGWPRILLETTAGHGDGLCHRFEDLAFLLERLEPAERFGVCVDTCHVFAAGYELRTPAGYRATWGALDRSVGLERVGLIHANDARAGLGSRRDLHAHIGEGELGLPAFALLMNDPALARIPKVIELPKLRDGIAMDPINVGVLRRLARPSGRVLGPR
jgi:deoxyribonuclease-4